MVLHKENPLFHQAIVNLKKMQPLRLTCLKLQIVMLYYMNTLGLDGQKNLIQMIKIQRGFGFF